MHFQFTIISIYEAFIRMQRYCKPRSICVLSFHCEAHTITGPGNRYSISSPRPVIHQPQHRVQACEGDTCW